VAEASKLKLLAFWALSPESTFVVVDEEVEIKIKTLALRAHPPPTHKMECSLHVVHYKGVVRYVEVCPHVNF
jgi:hypothetical protein